MCVCVCLCVSVCVHVSVRVCLGLEGGLGGGRGTRSIYIIKVHTTCFNVVTSNDSRKDEKNPMCHFRVF